MSFGSLAESSTLKLALETAYNSSILVAAAGNDRLPIGPCPVPIICLPFYPAAYNYVLGIEDRPRPPSGYTNWDQDGPIVSYYANLLNYELAAPGTGIMSTVPNGGYATLTGTSMATPLVAGALALYAELKPDDSKELMFANLINTSENPATPYPGFVDFLSAIEVEPTPKLALISSVQRDTINSQNGNGFWEPGETIEILPLIKNYWGPTDDVRVGIAFAEFEDQTKATIVQNEIEIGSITAYASLQDLFETLKITIADDVVNNVDIKFDLTAWSGPDQEFMSEPTEIVINVKNSILLYGNYNQDLTLYPDTEYLVSGNFSMSEGTTLTILPGVLLKMADNVRILINGDINSVGTPENKIIFSAENNSWKGFVLGTGANANFEFCVFKNICCEYSSYVVQNNYGSDLSMKNSLIFDNTTRLIQTSQQENHIFENVNIYDNIQIGLYSGSSTNINLINSNIIRNNQGYLYSQPVELLELQRADNAPGTAFNNNNVFDNDIYGNTFQYQSSQSTILEGPNYFGSSNEETINAKIVDFSETGNSGVLEVNYSTQAQENPSGIVWKVEVNGYDAQDEYALLDPVGVGTHEFKVYFNRAMDTSVNPRVFYGVIIPYTQNLIAEEGTWSADGKIYTVNHEINIGAADGINRIRVQEAQDLDYFKIPVEDFRFNFLLQSAGSASTGFFAAGGLGKIDLEWLAPSADDIDDVLGYNMYRYQIDADGVESEPEKLNETLIIEDTDPSTTGVYFSDYAVLEGETYFYKYKILRTSFEETDYSNTVSSSPLTSTLGDSNGDFDVNVLDLVHDVDYILGNNPEPFIFVAGDVNADNTINVLDIVGTVDIIFNGDGGDTGSGSLDPNFYPSQAIGFADFSWEGNDLYVESMHNIGGLQLAFDADFEYVLHELPGIERLDYTQDQLKVLMLYSFNNTTIASTRTKLLTRVDATQDININLAVAGTTTGAKLTPRFKDIELAGIASPFQSSELEFLNLFPNPTSGEVTLMYYLPEQMDGAVAKVYDMLGRLVWAQAIDKKQGMQQANLNLNTLQKGNYIVLISAHKNGGTKNIANKTLIIK